MYSVIKKLGAGSFGKVYECVKDNTKKYAVKVENKGCEHPQLFYESRILKKLNLPYGHSGIPVIYKFQMLKKQKVLIMELLGIDLETHHIKNKNPFTPSFSDIMLQLLDALAFIHSRGILHRDLKPSNFCYSRDFNRVKIVDFGLSKTFLDKERFHIPAKEKQSVTGTLRFCSVRTNLRRETSRRDDCESMGYVIVYLKNGKLPWQNLRVRKNEKKNDVVGQKKLKTKLSKLCESIPSMMRYFRSVRSLRFSAEPNYKELAECIKSIEE